MRNGFKFLKQFENRTSQFEIVFKSLARFSTQFRVRKFVINHNSLATKKTLNFSGPCGKVRPSKLTNHSTCTNLEIIINSIT